ncbi:MAG: late competence development ComFB family protein [Spirochaetota bacterium]
MELSQNNQSIEKYDLSRVKNVTAEKVTERVERFLAETDDICTCEQCVLDIITFILNRVTPVYRVSLLGQLHPDHSKNRKLALEIEVALKEGINRIRKHPHHD